MVIYYTHWDKIFPVFAPNFIVVQPLLVCFDTLSSLHEYLMKNASISKINARIELAIPKIVSIPNFIVVRPLLVCFWHIVIFHEYLMKNVSMYLLIDTHVFFYYKNQIIFAEAQCSYFWMTFTQISIPPIPPIMPLKCIWEHVLSFSTFHFLQRWLVFDLVLQILLNLRLSVLIKFVLIKKNVYLFLEMFLTLVQFFIFGNRRFSIDPRLFWPPRLLWTQE